MTDAQKELIVKLGQLAKFKTLIEGVVYTKPEGGIPKTDLAQAVQVSLGKADTALQSSDLSTLNEKVSALEALIESDSDGAINKFNEIVSFLANITDSQTLEGIVGGINNAVAAKYTKPEGGIPKTDLTEGVQGSLDKADSAYQLPATGLPKADLSSDVQASLGKADTALQASDVAGKADKVANPTVGNFAGLDANGNLTDSGSKAADFKTVQAAVSDPSADGTGLEFIDSVSQNANGEVTLHKKGVQAASVSQAGTMSAAHYAKLDAIAYATDADIEAIFA